MLPDIDSLALFVQAAELSSLTKAAEASHIGLAAASRRIEALSRLHQVRPALCMVITESNRALLDRVACTTLSLGRGELAVKAPGARAGEGATPLAGAAAAASA